MSPGGVCVLDDCGSFTGATEAIDEYCGQYGYSIGRFEYSRAPSYFLKR
jgi:hypothetical protein